MENMSFSLKDFIAIVKIDSNYSSKDETKPMLRTRLLRNTFLVETMNHVKNLASVEECVENKQTKDVWQRKCEARDEAHKLAAWTSLR